MKKGLPKRRDLRKRIKELEAENKRLKFPTPVLVAQDVRPLKTVKAYSHVPTDIPPDWAYQYAISKTSELIGRSIIGNGFAQITEEKDETGTKITATVIVVESPFTGGENEYIQKITGEWRKKT